MIRPATAALGVGLALSGPACVDDGAPPPEGMSRSASTRAATAGHDLSWSNDGLLSGDFDGDGKPDLMTMYDYGNGAAGLIVTPGGATSVGAPYRVYYSTSFDVKRAKLAAGDFNGDHKTDVLALYDDGPERGWASARLLLFPGTSATGDSASPPVVVWSGGPGSFSVDASQVYAGDFDDDKKDDLIVLYDFTVVGGGFGSAAVYVFPGTAATGANAAPPYEAWIGGTGSFDASTAKAAVGDFDNDHKADLITLHDDRYAAGWGSAELIVFPGVAGHGHSTPSTRWFTGPGNFAVEWTKVTAGDFDGDGKSDLLALYNYDYGYGPGAAELFVFPGSAGATTPYSAWFVDKGTFDSKQAQITAADFTGDGRADVLAAYRYVGDDDLGSAGLYLLPGTKAVGQDATSLVRYAPPGALDYREPAWRPLDGTWLSAPAVATNLDGTVEVFAVGADHALYHARQLTPGGATGPWLTFGPSFASYRPAVARDADGRLEVFAVNSAGALVHVAQTSQGGWGAWSVIGDHIASAPAVALDRDGRLEVFATDDTYLVRYARQSAPNSATFSALAGTRLGTSAAPIVARAADGQLALFASGGDGAVWTQAQGPDGGWGNAPGSLGGATLLQPAVAANDDGRLELFIADSDGNVLHKWQTDAAGTWLDHWVTMAGRQVARTPTVVLGAHRVLQLVGIDATGEPFFRVQRRDRGGQGDVLDGWTDDVPLGGMIDSPPDAALDANGIVELYGRGRSNALFRGATVTPPLADFTIQVHHPLDGCLSPMAAESLRTTLKAKFASTYPGVDVLDRCIGDAHTFAVFTDAVAPAARHRAHALRDATLDGVHLLPSGVGIGFHVGARFATEYGRLTVPVPGDIGGVHFDRLETDFSLLDTIETRLTGSKLGLDVKISIVDQLYIADPQQNQVPRCHTQAMVFVAGQQFSKDLPQGGVGCVVVSKLPIDLGIELPRALDDVQLAVRYDLLTSGFDGLTAHALLSLVPRLHAVNIECPQSSNGLCSDVTSADNVLTEVFAIAPVGLRAPLTVGWTASGGAHIDDPLAAQTAITFKTYGTKTVQVHVVDADNHVVDGAVTFNFKPQGAPP